MRSFDRANAFACAAVNTFVRIYDVFSVFFRNAGSGALLSARTATDTLVRVNDVSHNKTSVLIDFESSIPQFDSYFNSFFSFYKLILYKF